jgi:phosphonate transport system ATP-binding protein
MADRQGLGFRVEGLTLHYGSGSPALAGLNLSIAPGEILGLVGPSGAGKTSLLSVLGAALRPDEGRVTIDGQELGRLSSRELRRLRSRLGFIHQDHRLVPNLRVHQNVSAGRLGRLGALASLRQLLSPPRPVLAEIHALLERVGIEEKLYARSDRLSGGERQRVAIARALYQVPGGLLADEPVASVDPARAADTLTLLTALSREGGLTLVASLHDIELARAHFPRLVGLRGGRIVFDRPTAEIADAEFAALYALEEG